ncbi:MAG: YHYH protein [Saprospiraceae bacterium]
MRKFTLITCFLFFCALHSYTQITPEIYSWILNTNGDVGYNNIPSNIQQVQYSAANVYVSATCIPGYDIGPWAGNPNIPANQNFVFKITRQPVANSGTPVNAGLGHIGVWTNGVSVFNPKDAMSYNNQNVWHQNAVVVEGPSFDDCLGHPAPNGEYHHHLNPTCLYNDSITDVHSPIIGFAFDGFPIYGAFAYADTTGTGGIKRMQSSYHKRNISTRSTLPDGSTASSSGPNVSGNFPLGYYIEDFEFIQASGDLDVHNGRFCVTPDYPQGQYCYFVTLDSNLIAEYPYIIGPTYYGTVPAGNTGPMSGHNVINESVVTYNGSTAVVEIPVRLKFSIFPNPAHESFNILVEKDMPNNLHLELFNSEGQSLLNAENIHPAIPYSFDISTYPKGIYFIHLYSGEEQYVKKIILD